MKRFLVYGSLALLLGTVMAAGFALKWLLETPEGVRWLLKTVSQHTQVTISARTVSGGFDSALRLEGFSARWSEGELTVADLRLNCKPLLIPFRILAVQELSLRGVQFRDNTPPSSTAPEFEWPHVTGFPTRISVWIDRLTVEDFSYQNQNRSSVTIPKFSAALLWQDSRLSITNLSLSNANGRVSGSVSTGFSRPSLVSNLTFEPARPMAGNSRFELRTRLQPGQSPEQVAGEVTFTALAEKSARYTLTGSVGLTRKALNLHGLTLTEKGRRGSIQTTGTLMMTGEARLRLSSDGLDLTPELGKKMTLSGTIELNGDSEQYTGRFNLAANGKNWQKMHLTGLFKGDSGSVDLSAIDAAVLSGVVRGNLRVDWRKELMLKASLQGRRLDPAGLDPTWNGVVNFDLDSMAAWVGGRLRQGEAHGHLLESRLRGKALAGEIAASLDKDDLRINRLLLTGKGFDIHATGILSQRLDVTANISDLSGLVPQTGGRLELKGWGRYAAGVTSGNLSVHGSNLAAKGVHISSVNLKTRLDDRPERLIVAAAELVGVSYQDLQVKNASLKSRLTYGTERQGSVDAELSGVAYRGMRADQVTLKTDGSLGNHRLELALRSQGAAITGRVSGGYADGRWQGELSDFSGHDLVGPWRLAAPASLSISPQIVTITRLVLNGLPSEKAELSGRLQLQPLRGSAKVDWSGLDLTRANQWLGDTRLDGESSGNLQLVLPGNDRLFLAGKASASGKVTLGKQTVTIQKAFVNLDAGDRGTTAMLEFKTGEGISVTGRFTSPAPATLSVPSHGELHASWDGLDPALAKRWLPQGIDLQGRLSGEITGKLLPKQRFDLNGTVSLADGAGSWQSEGRELTAALRRVRLTWNWRGDSLNGVFSMSLADSGEARGSFQLPLPARFDAVPDPSGRLRGTISGKFHEKGVLTTLFPGLFQDTKGQLEVDLQAGGTWQKPAVTGTARLTQAGGYLPTAGIHLTDVRLDANLNGTHVQITSFRVTSGPGSLEGSADLDFTGKKLVGYHGRLHGERVQVVHLPELQLMVSPELTFEGNLDTFTASGVVRIPEMLVNNQRSTTMIKPSRDVVVAGRSATSSRQTGPKLDLRLRLLLGDQVVVKAEGLDARLEGEINLRMSGSAATSASGEIRVAKGSYHVYGVKLDIKRGRALFSGGPVERPTLDILALREVDDVKAGVTVTGTPEAPLIKLYSEPALPDTDILAYVVLGQKLGESGQQTALLMQAASLLTSPGQSPGLQDQLKQLVRLDTLTYSTDKDRSSGYKTIEPGLRNTPQSSKENSGVSQSMLLLGKYLTPQLYVSYGQSLFSASQQFRARYTISKQWEVESKVSAEATGGDLYFRIELD